MSDQNPASAVATPTAAPASAAVETAAAPANAGQTATPAVTNSSSAAVPASSATPAATTPGADPSAKPATPATPAEYKLELPKDSPLTPNIVASVSNFAKSIGLSQEQAQKLLDAQSTSAISIQKAQAEALAKQSDEWKAALQADTEFGGDKFNANLEAAQTAFTKFGSPELKKALDESGYGNFPPLLKFAAAIGKAMREDSIAGPAATANAQPARTPGSPPTEAELKAAYPTMFPAT